jgi:alkanesulfonate monooxygenase SsuD/methylene tetrahydromethanopterin reductase-like flavin-dependent oxidoreductase (luciferase family)
MTRPVRFGVTLPQIKRTWQEAREAALEFDALGFHSVWVCDHLYGVPMPQLPILEAWSELAAVAAVTERVELGTLVTPPFFRNPAVLAKMWSEEQVRYDGEFARAVDVRCEPKPVRPPPILIGGGGERVLMGIVARHADIWNNLAIFQPQLAHKVDAMKRRCDELNRDFDTLEISQQCTVVIAEDSATAQQHLEKAKKVYGGHMGGAIEEHGIWGAPEQVIERIQRHVDLGCTLFIIEFFGRDTREPARIFAEEVVHAFD